MFFYLRWASLCVLICPLITILFLNCFITQLFNNWMFTLDVKKVAFSSSLVTTKVEHNMFRRRHVVQSIWYLRCSLVLLAHSYLVILENAKLLFGQGPYKLQVNWKFCIIGLHLWVFPDWACFLSPTSDWRKHVLRL